MMPVVIDTNVLLVANGIHEEVSDRYREACVSALLARQRSGMVAIDEGNRILGEYLNKTHPNQPKGTGDAFLKWLLQNQHNASRVCRVLITEAGPDRFVEFPDPLLEEQFDPPDRKFAAVANAHPAKPPIWQAADSKWLDWWPHLAARGISVDFLCPADAAKFYKKKFPKRKLPAFPPGP